MKRRNVTTSIFLGTIVMFVLSTMGCNNSQNVSVQQGARPNDDSQPTPPTTITASVATAQPNAASNYVSWTNGNGFFWVQRRVKTGDNTWGDWSDVGAPGNDRKFTDAYAPVNQETQYRVGASVDKYTSPSSSQWSSESNTVNNPG
jgi:hypothetical protein